MREVKKLIEYIPPFLKDVREYNRIFNAEDIELKKLDENLKSLLIEVIVKTAKSYGLDRYEKIYNINNSTNNINARRAMILTKINSRVPFTYKWLYNQLLENFGEDGFEINIDYDKYQLEIVIKGLQSEVADILIENFYEKLPANMQQIFTLTADCDYKMGSMVVQKEFTTLKIDTSVLEEEETIGNDANVGIVVAQTESNKITIDNSTLEENEDIAQDYNLGGMIVQKESETIFIDNSIITEEISINANNYMASNVIQKENVKIKEE